MKRVAPDETWSAEARYVFEHDRVEWWDPRPMPHRYHVYHAYIELLLRLVEERRPRTLLNVGCAQATVDLLLAERGVKVTALDIRPGYIEYAKLRHERGDVRWVLGNFFDAEVPGAPFDLVMSHHVIEHVTDPAGFVQRMADLTTPGGTVIVSTPNHDYFRNRLPTFTEIGDLTRFPGFANSTDGPDHIFAFTSQELVALGESAGLTVDRVFYYESPLLAGHMKTWHLHRFLPERMVKVLEPLSSVPVIGRRFFHHVGLVLKKPSGPA